MIRRRLSPAALSLPAALLLPTTPAAAQMHSMDGMTMPGMAMPAVRPPAKAKAKATRTPARKPMPHRATRAAPQPAQACPPDHAAMGHCQASPASTPSLRPAMPTMPGMPGMQAMPDSATAGSGQSGTDLPAGDAAPPSAPSDRAADRYYAPAAMAAADAAMRAEHGGMRFSQILFNLAEVQVQRGDTGYRWDGAGWFGGDIDRVVVKSEGEGRFGGALDTAEVQALYAHAIGPYFNLQAGVRQDLGVYGGRTHAVLGVEGLAPYWFDVEAALFVSDKGVRARGEAWYDQRLTQRAILQPRVEVDLAAQDEPDARIGAGLSTVEAGLRLRYEIAREFAPYVGVSWQRRYGATARYARADGDRSGGAALVLGLRGWF